MHVPASIAELCDERALRARLEALSARAPVPRLTVGIAHGDKAAIAAIGEGAAATGGATAAIGGATAERNGGARFPVGCLAKLLTVTLARRVLAPHSRGVEAPLHDVLPRARRARRWAGITIRQLMEHTHGLDDGALERAPRDARGRIDAGRLTAELARAGALAAPGRFYSYGNAGAWLLGAALEHTAGASYAALLHDTLLHPLGFGRHRGRRRRARRADAPICPALGIGLALSVPELLELLRHALAHARTAPVRSAGAALTRLPGWHPVERGIRLGWKYYGAGWFGHASAWPGHSTLTALRPRDASAVVVASGHRAATLAALGLFGGLLPGLAPPAAPRPLDARRRDAFQPERYLGRYRAARGRAWITLRAPEALELRLARHPCAGRRGSAALRPENSAALVPCTRHRFFTQPPLRDHVFVQCIDPTEGSFRYLWNGRRLYLRERDAQ